MAAPRKTSGTTAETKAEDTQTKTEADNPAPKAETKTEANTSAPKTEASTSAPKAEAKTEDKPKPAPKPAGKTKAEDKKGDGKLSEVQRRSLSASYDPVVIESHRQAAGAARASQDKLRSVAPRQIRQVDTSFSGGSVEDAIYRPGNDDKGDSKK